MKKPFRRRFEPKLLSAHLQGDKGAKSLIRALVERWVLPGETLVEKDRLPLRLAVRDGYLNLYVNGQSVANISAPGRQPRISVHWKYVKGVRNDEKQKAPHRTYVTIEGDALFREDAQEIVDGWISTANSYAGDEKRFVEHLVASNANVIDVEMGLPGDQSFRSCKPEKVRKDDSSEPRPVAPRMDVVVTVPNGASRSVAFWEAKLATNGELRAQESGRASNDRTPHVWYQIQDYEKWLSIPGREQEVAEAYRHTARILLELAELAGKRGDATGVWKQLAAAAPHVHRRPGIVIADYEPKSGGGGAQARRASSFQTYREWLEELGCCVQQVSGPTCERGQLTRLPVLAA